MEIKRLENREEWAGHSIALRANAFQALVGKLLFNALLVFLMAGCVSGSVARRLVHSSESRKAEFDQLVDALENKPRQKISWNEANLRLKRDNPALQQSRRMLKEAERQTSNQWLSLIPRTSAFLNLSQSLASITDLERDDLHGSVTASFNIPNPFEFYAGLYGTELQKQNARWSQQLDERRAFTELYNAFVEADSLKEEELLLERNRQKLLRNQSLDFARVYSSIVKQAKMLERRRIIHRGNVNRLLNTPGGNWELAGDMPSVSYRKHYRSLRIGRDFGQLALNLYAVQIEGAILQTQRVKFRQWPTISFGLSNPPIYTSDGANSIAAEDFSLFSGTSKSLDVTDLGGRHSIQNAEYRLKFTREQLRLRMEREAAQLMQICSAYDQLIKEEKYLAGAIERFDRAGTSDPKIVLEDLEKRGGLEQMLWQTRRQIKQLDLQLVIWDERYWKS